MTASPRLIPPQMDAQLEAHLYRIPEYCREGLALYIRYGVPPGDFLLAVLCNDLRDACARADDVNQRALYDYVFVLVNYAPIACWGDIQSVMAWIAKGEALRDGGASSEASQ